MPDDHDLRYHGRRSVDELVGALKADSAGIAEVHRELSLLHLDRFVAAMKAAAADIGSQDAR